MAMRLETDHIPIVTVLPSANKSKRSKSRSTPATPALSAARTLSSATRLGSGHAGLVRRYTSTRVMSSENNR